MLITISIVLSTEKGELSVWLNKWPCKQINKYGIKEGTRLRELGIPFPKRILGQLGNWHLWSGMWWWVSKSIVYTWHMGTDAQNPWPLGTFITKCDGAVKNTPYSLCSPNTRLKKAIYFFPPTLPIITIANLRFWQQQWAARESSTSKLKVWGLGTEGVTTH